MAKAKFSEDDTPEIQAERRLPKCPGCKEPVENHQWGIPSKYCEGMEKSSPKRLKNADLNTDSESLDSLRAELEALTLEEEALRRQDEGARLKEKIAAKRASIDELNRRRVKGHESGATLTSHDLPQLTLEARRESTPLEDLLAATNLDSALPSTWLHRADTVTIPSGTQSTENHASTTEMFLKPRAIPKGEKPLLIVDFVTHIVPQDEEETLGNQGNAKIVVTYGPKKPKLETVTMSQWVVANTRILYALLSEGKLASQTAIQQYLAYTVKIMELSAKFDWKSILMYDNEFRKLQAIYNLSWSFDSTHLHTVMLQPIFKPNPPTKSTPHSIPNSRAAMANFTSDGRIICRNFNGQKGCTLHSCNFAHVCNRKIAGKACGLSHPGVAHKTADPTSTQ